MKGVAFHLEDAPGGICTIAAAVDGNGKYVDYRLHKYGHLELTVSPYPGPEPYLFEWVVFPAGLFPHPYAESAALEGAKGALTEPLKNGCRVVLVKISVRDGSYHDEETDEDSFRMAARLAVRDALSKATLVPL